MGCKDKNSPWYLVGFSYESSIGAGGGELSKRLLGGNMRCKDKNSLWHLVGFSYESSIGGGGGNRQNVYWVGTLDIRTTTLHGI